MATAKPVDIAHSPSRNVLIITWEGGIESTLPVPYLRAWCPCAGCQGHGIRVEHRPGAAEQEQTIAGLFELGAYALGIRFADGHDSGIYTWEWLWKISPEAEPLGLKHGAFEHGDYLPS